MKRSEGKFDVVELLKEQSIEIARQGHNGWGNTMMCAVEEIGRLKAKALAYRDIIRRANDANDNDRVVGDILNEVDKLDKEQP